MYSYEDRIRAVELYIKLGKSVRPTIRQLGYPTKNSLKGWYNEYQFKLDLSAGYAGREPKFSQAQKAAAIEHYLTHDRCIAATMRALGYPGRGTLTNWVREAFPEARRAVVGSVGQRRYPESLKQSGVMELCTRQESAQAVADKLGVCRPTLINPSSSSLKASKLPVMPATPRNRAVAKGCGLLTAYDDPGHKGKFRFEFPCSVWPIRIRVALAMTSVGSPNQEAPLESAPLRQLLLLTKACHRW